jgi:hypothetical protein
MNAVSVCISWRIKVWASTSSVYVGCTAGCDMADEAEP